MRAYEIIEGEAVDAIALRERPDPQPAPGEVVIDVKACSLNFRDLTVIRGGYGGADKPLGSIPLSDGAGVISAVGDDVVGFEIGDRVSPAFMPDHLDGPLTPEKQAGSLGGERDGMLAEKVAMPAHGVVKIPDHLSFAEAATLPCAGVTAWYAQFVGGSLKPGDSVLMLGTGGVSIFSLQFAKLAGARAIITSSSDEKLERAKELGADAVVNYRTTPEWHEEVIRLTDGRGVDHAVEVGGPGTLNRTLQAVRFSGSISLMGVLTGFQDDVDTLSILRKNIKVQGTYVGSVAMMEDMIRAIDVNRMSPVVDRTFGFEQATEALLYQESGSHFGKVVISLE